MDQSQAYFVSTYYLFKVPPSLDSIVMLYSHVRSGSSGVIILHCIFVKVVSQVVRCCCFCNHMKASPESQVARHVEGAKQQFSGDNWNRLHSGELRISLPRQVTAYWLQKHSPTTLQHNTNCNRVTLSLK